MRKSLRYLRIAFSATCLIACVLLIGLWVRSYWWNDSAIGPISRTRILVSFSSLGRLGGRLDDPTKFAAGWHFIHSSHAKRLKEDEEDLRSAGVVVSKPKPTSWPVFGQCWDSNFRVAHGLVVLFFATLGIVAAPFIKWRFSLRTLLIATTLVAVVLGLIVWAVR
jgi:hypothetical protein